MAEYKQLGAYEALDRSTVCAMDMSCGVFQISGRFKHQGICGYRLRVLRKNVGKILWLSRLREIVPSAVMRVDVLG